MNNKENNTQFNAFMEKAYETYTKNLLEEQELYDNTHKPYTEWLDSLSWEEICDYADLFNEKGQ